MKQYLILILLSVILFSCKKDKDETDPKITIQAPYTNQWFNVLDTIHLTAKVSDETKLSSVQVVLRDANGINAMNSVPVSVQSNDFQFSLDYILGEIHLEGGEYHLVVTASDGVNSQSAGVTIQVNPLPLNKRYFYFATEVGNSTVITRYDSVFANPQLLNFGGKFCSISSTSWYQRFYVAGEANAPFNAYNAYNHAQTWSVMDLGAGLPYFSNLYGDGKLVYAGYYDGRLISYNFSGNVVTNYQTGSSSYYPVFEFVAGNTCYVGMKDFLSTGTEFRRFDKSTGVQQSSNGVAWIPVGMGEKTGGEVYIAGNDNTGQGKLCVYYNASSGFYYPAVTIPAGAINCATGIDGDYFLMAHSNGNIYRYRYSTNSLVSIASGIVASRISYNAELNELYVSSGSNFYIYNVQAFALQLKQSFSHTGNIDDFQVMFNK